MTRGKFLTQAVFAIVLAMMVVLPVVTYGCLKLRQTEKQGELAPGPGGAARERPAR